MPDDRAPAPPASAPDGRLGRIALSLSGGGYRAAAFHLGTLRFLDQVGLLRDVVGLSTVSGGSITGMAWVASVLDGRSFDDFHRWFSGWLKRTNVVRLALDDLTARRGDEAHQWPSLIRSAADVYDRDDLLRGRRFADLLGAPAFPLEEAIFNATEFHTGVAFRFRRSDNAYARIGNGNYRVPRAVAQHIRLADVVAASSCFPGGFEPLVFPQAFRWPAEFPLEQAQAALGPGFRQGLPLMDGGVYDNQGVESLVLAFRKTTATTLLISDVSARNRPMYDVPPPPGGRGFLTLRGVGWMGVGLLLLAAVAFVVLAWHGWETARTGDWGWEDYFLYLVPGLLAGGVAAALVWLRGHVRMARALALKMIRVDVTASLQRLTVPEFIQMLALRASSVLALTSSIFMARIRGLVYKGVYADDAYAGRRMSNLIYTLAEDAPKLFDRAPWLRPRPHLVDLAEQAEAMPTTLWFTDDSQFHTLERAGCVTVCFVLLRFIVEGYEAAEYEPQGAPLHELYVRLRKEWDVFNGAAIKMPPPAPLETTVG